MLETILTLMRLALLIAGVIAVAVWAVRQPDDESTLLKRLAKKTNKSAGKEPAPEAPAGEREMQSEQVGRN